jgi:hypothetical protein
MSQIKDRCTDSEVWTTRDADKNAFGDMFRQSVSQSVPIAGNIVAGLIPDTLTNNVVRSCPGVVIDRRSSFALDYILLASIILGILIFYIA